jgi:hypothetical protein
MITVKIIAMVWSLVMAMCALAAKINDIGALGVLIIKFLSLVTLIYFGYELVKMLP